MCLDAIYFKSLSAIYLIIYGFVEMQQSRCHSSYQKDSCVLSGLTKIVSIIKLILKFEILLSFPLILQLAHFLYNPFFLHIKVDRF